jgi:acyl-coenzyme A thioesterase PaaI-like protein
MSAPSRVLHGAVAPSMMDVACYLAVMAELEPGRERRHR